MTFDAYWQQLQDATPGLRRPEGTMRIGVLSFKEAVRRACQRGRQDADEQAHLEHHDSIPDFFKGLLGGKR